MGKRVRSPRVATACAVAGLLWSLALPGPGHAEPGDAAAGQSLYQAKCGGCHSLDANRIGPMHRGVVGRKVASAPGFAYSPALKKLGGVWTAARLDAWLKNPQSVAQGARMFLMIADAGQRRDIIAYLAANSPSAKAR